MPEKVESDMNILQQSAFDIDLNLDPLFCSWFSGWVDGEGCFMGKTEYGVMSIRSILAVRVRDDDAQLVYNVRETLQCGTVLFKPRQKQNNNNAKDTVQWACHNTSACRHILIPLFDKYPLRSKKNRDYKIWRELVIAISEKQHLNGNRDYVLGLCQQLHDIKRYIPRVRIDA